MGRLYLKTDDSSEKTINHLYESLSRRVAHGERGACPIDLTAASVRLCQSQSCGKCAPCRIGLDQILSILERLLNGSGTKEDITLLEKTSSAIADTADCAIGFDAAKAVLSCIDTYRKDFKSHVETGSCLSKQKSVPCTWYCPAHVDIPGYIALTAKGRYTDAVRLVRKDNPFPSTCALVCERPCEAFCRRGIVDEAVNIRAIKHFAVQNAGIVPPEPCMPDTDKKIAVIGGGPAGLSAAYYLSLMGHKVTVFEKRKKLGGMLRYGIPTYRLPDECLDYDIDAIIATGVKVVLQTEIGKDKTLEELRSSFDSTFITIGAHSNKPLKIPGEDLKGVFSAVEFLSDMGDDNIPDFTGKTVLVIGGGNVAMDATRTSIRLGAKSVKCVYRRRVPDMTALPEEIEGALAEGAEVITLQAPVRIEGDENGNATALIVQPQIISACTAGRPAPRNADKPEESIECDIVLVAIGQNIESEYFGKCGIELDWDQIKADTTCQIPDMPDVFAGGDCMHGPSTVIKAIETGKVAAANIDSFLGFNNKISVNLEIPSPSHKVKPSWGRVADKVTEAGERKQNFELVELCISEEEMIQECARCYRCDNFGKGKLRDGRVLSW